MNAPPIVSELVLIGGGHGHVHVLKMLGMPKYREILWQHGIRVTLIAKDIHTPYSGMLPGYVAGHYSYDQIHLDLRRLCRFANIRLIHTACTQIEYKGSGGGLVHCDDGRPPLPYDVLSIDVGSSPGVTAQSILNHPRIVPVKPIANFCRFYEHLYDKFKAETITSTATMEVEQVASCNSANSATNHKVYRLCIVGGGAGGIELALSVQVNLLQLLEKSSSTTRLQMVVITKGSKLMEGHNSRVQQIMARILKERNVEVHFQAEVVGVIEKGGISQLQIKGSQKTIHFDDCLWCTTAAGATWLSEKTPFDCDTEGFIKIDTTYQVQNFPGVFACGDCAHMVKHPRPKAGVFAVRAGPPLLENLIASLTSGEIKSHIPQSTFLGIITTGDQYAIASKGHYFCLEGKLIWKWKDWIDRTWMSKYTDLPDLETMMNQVVFKRNPKVLPNTSTKGTNVLDAFASDPMRCGGCGAKVGSATLSRVLKALHRRQVQRAIHCNLPPPPSIDLDDAAIVSLYGVSGGAFVHSIDYFRSIVDDPYVFGKIAAIHALSDIHAMGAGAKSALSLAVTPFAADEAITESTLLQLLSGVSDVLQDEQIPLIGGHTCEGTELACGLAVQGYIQDTNQLLRKRGGLVGDHIILTKPLGTGALFAADMRAKAKGEYVVEALSSMVVSNRYASQVASSQRTGTVRAATDITGFGLIGHMLEMLLANDESEDLPSIGAHIDLVKVPFLRGGLLASSQQIFSSLQPQNMSNRRAIQNHTKAVKKYPIQYPLLFDPQTAGGLLMFIDPEHSERVLKSLQEHYPEAAIIGELEELQTYETDLAGSSCHTKARHGSADHRVRVT